MHTQTSSGRSSSSFKRLLAACVVSTLTLSGSAWAAGFKAELQGQSFGSANWDGTAIGWAELDLVPIRVFLMGGPASGKTITVQFDHTKAKGSNLLQGIQNLYSFTPSANVVITSGPTLIAPSGQDVWSYTFTVDLTNAAPGFVEFRARLAAGSHYFTGASLSLSGSPSLGNLSISKPTAAAGAPDLSIVKSGPNAANAGQTISYSIRYLNATNGTTATGVQISDMLPDAVNFVSCTGGCSPVGNTVTWDLGDVARGASGVLTYKVAVTNVITTGFTFQNSAAIVSSQDDANLSNNFSSVITTVTSNCVPPSIVAEPSDMAACAGGSATFSVAANGSATLQYQWRKDGIDISGANSDTLTLNSLTLADSGSYDVVVSNLCGTMMSSPAILTVGGPVITTDPSSDSKCVGDSAAFMVEASGDLLTYQWRKDGTDIAGATNSLLEITPVAEQDAGGYDVIVSGTCGSKTSIVATLTVNVAPSIVSDPVSASVCEGDSALLSVGANGSSLAYQWRKDGVGIAGANSSSYSTTESGSYDVVVIGACGVPALSAPATVTVNLPPVINDGPVDATVTVGDPVSLSVTASGSGLTYQWRKDGNDIAGANDSTFSIAATTEGDAGSYDVVVSGTCGSAEVSSAVTVTVNPPSNHAPVAMDDSYNMLEDGQLVMSAPGVLTNDTDQDGDTLTTILIDAPSHGVVALNIDGSFTYTPLAGFFGSDTFTYQASDGTNLSATATATINVAHVNHDPVAVDDSLTIAENSGSHAVDALANDSDSDGDILTITDVSAPSNGSAAITGGGTGLTYTPNADFSGSDSFTYTVSDGQGGTASATVNVTVMHVAVAPVAQDDSYEVSENDTLEIAAPGVLGNDTNMEATALTAMLVSEPAHGSVTVNTDGSFTYVPNDNYNGPDSFTYMANNGALDSNVATVHINVLIVHGAGDVDLYIKSAVAKIDWASGTRDSLTLRGQINPRGMIDDLSGATIAVDINGVNVLSPQTLDRRGKAKSTVGAIKTSCRLKNANGAYSIKVSGMDISQALGLANQTEAGVTMVTVRLTINGAALDLPVTTAQIECPYRTKKDKASSVKFNFRKNRSMTGVFNSNKTAAAEKGRVAVRMKGVIESDGSGPIVPTGDVTIQIGNAQIAVPVTTLSASGNDYQLPPQIAPSAGTTTLTKFLLRNSKRAFSLSIASSDIPLPAPDPNGPMKYQLPVLIEVQTATGPMYFESIIELKRSKATSTKWKR